MADLILDTSVLGDFFEQFFSSLVANRGQGRFVEGTFLSQRAARELNRIVLLHSSQDLVSTDLVIISPFAFIEMARRWDNIVSDRFSIDQVEAFSEQPPDWVSVATWDETLLPAFLDVPTHVWFKGESRAIEWTDAIHAATALARGDSNLLATTDSRLHALQRTGVKLVCV
jgi:predicted nucleic acid-binding protein